MKVLHTGDLHLGAKSESVLRLEEQRQTLLEICEICDKESIDVVAIAGDIFHTSTPSAEAEDLFYDFLEKLTVNNNRAVLVVAGNHDDPKRLAACLSLAKKHNIVIVSDLSPLPQYPVVGNINIVKTGIGYVKLKKENEYLNVGLLPYPSESRLFSSNINNLNFEKNNYQHNIEVILDEIRKQFEPNVPSMFLTHLYLVGAHELTSENNKTTKRMVKLGDAMAVSPTIFKDCNYVALGHLHSTQQIKYSNSKIFYAGSIIKLRIYDSQPNVIIWNSTTNTCKALPLKAPWDLKEVCCNENQIFDQLEKIPKNTLIYLKIKNTENIKNSIITQIKQNYPNVLNIILESTQTLNLKTRKIKDLNTREIFIEFYKAKTNNEPTKALLETFLNLVEESNES